MPVELASLVDLVEDVLANCGTVTATADLAFHNPRALLAARGLTDIGALVTLEAR